MTNTQTKTTMVHRPGTIAATIEEALRRSARRKKRPMKYSEVLELVHKRHPGASTTTESVDYYAWNLRKQGVELKLDRKH